MKNKFTVYSKSTNYRKNKKSYRILSVFTTRYFIKDSGDPIRDNVHSEFNFKLVFKL
jgi:hypothetical protein